MSDSLNTDSPQAARNMSIKTYALLFSSVIVVVAVGIFAFSMMNYLEGVSRSDLEGRGRLVATSLEGAIGQDLALDDRPEVVERSRAILADSEDLLYLVITMRDGNALVFQKDSWSMEAADVRWANFQGPDGEDTAQVVQSEFTGEEVLHYGHQLSYLNSLSLGWVHAGISTKSYNAATGNFRTRILQMALIALAFGIPASLVFSRRFTRPIFKLQTFATNLAAGELNSKVDAGGTKEIAELSSTMNWMTRKLAESRDELQESLVQKASLREKEVLLREIHHRVKNNMQILGGLIRIQCRSSDSEEVRSVLMESETRIRSMALLHQKLYQSESISEIGFGSYVSVLTGELQRLYSGKGLRPRLEIDIAKDFALGLDTALPCGLIVNELVSNCFKYAFVNGGQGMIRITAESLSEGRFILSVEDNGAGMPEGFDVHEARSLGLRLVNMLVEQLDGELQVTSGKEGTRFAMELGASDYAERLGNT